MAMTTVISFAAFIMSGLCTVPIQQPGIGPLKNDINRDPQNTSDIVPDKYIAGGQPTEIGEFPWMVRLSINDRSDNSPYLCAGSLIGDRYVLTAAHCIEKTIKNYHDVTIYLGEYNQNTFPVDCVKGKCIKNKLAYPDKIIQHAHYNKKTFDNDIALLRLEKRVPRSAYIQPVALPPFDLDHDQNKGIPVAVVGWGETRTLQLSKVLLATEITLIPKSQCLKTNSDVPAKHLCAGDPKGRDTCPGDSGGPLLMYYRKRYYLSGVVSYGPDVKCGTAKMGFYTNVFKYKNWIKRNMKKY